MINFFLLVFSINTSNNIKTIGHTEIEISFSMHKKSAAADFSFPDAFWLNNIGEPNLPSALHKIGIPQHGDVEVEVVNNQEEVIKNITIEPVRYAGIYEPPIAEAFETQSDVYQKNRFYPTDLFTVSEPGYFRDLYTVDVRLNPVRYNPVSKELRISSNLKIKIKFKGTAQAKPIIDQAFEEIYKRTVANYEQCKTWRREPILNNSNPFASGVWFKIEVDTEGIYRIGYDEIKKAGLDPQQFDPKTMKIYTAAFDLLPVNVSLPFADSLIEVPVYVQGEDDHAFDNNDYLIFYGYPASHFVPDSEISWFENGYARKNVYWFTFGGSDGSRMQMVNTAYNGATCDTLVNEISHIEEDFSNPTRSGINWYWQDISPGEGPSGSGTIIIKHPKANGNGQVKVGIFTLASGTFSYQLSLNGQSFFNQTLSLGIYDNLPPYYLVGDATLAGDSSELTIDILRPSGTTVAFTAYLNSVDLEYARVTDMSLPFHAYYKTPRDYSIKCSNSSSSPFILDITDLKEPKMFYDFTVENNKLSLTSRSDSFQLLYFSKLSLAKTAELKAAIPGRLRTQSPGGEYLFITHKNFANAIMPLVNYRSQEYTTKVVTIDDIYDDFSLGKYDPLAVKHFLYYAYATNNWTTVPKFVLLVGDATYDYKNNLKKETPPNYVPMYESGTTLTGNPGIPPNHIYEGECVNFGAGEVIILGRIAVRTNQELRDYIDKLITYETGNIDGMWNRRIILAGDDEFHNPNVWEGPYLHSGACEDMIAYCHAPLYDFAKVYMVSYPPFSYPTKKPLAQAAFIRELNKGGLAGVFYGHGNTHQLADEALFFDVNMPEIHNGRRHFFFYFGSCTVGRFDDSDYECIGEQLVRIRDGAIGTMAATAGTGSYDNKAIGGALLNNVTDPDTNLTMGECSFIAKTGHWTLHYLLLGDPATKLRRAEDSMAIWASPDSLRPLQTLDITTDESRYYLKAFVRDTTKIDRFDESTADKISGYVFRLVGPSLTPFGYAIDGKEIFQGYWDTDTASIIAPKILTTHQPVIKLSTFGNGKSGRRDSIGVYGVAVPSSDQIGPEVTFYDGARRLSDNDWVSKEFTLTGKVTDQSGINLLYSVDNARGFYLYINQDIDNKIDLRDYFIYNKNSYTSGEFNVQLGLPKSTDTITINVADNNDKQTVKTIVLNAETADQISIENFLIYPNPLKKNTGGIWLTFSLTNSGLVTLKIFTIAGRLIKTINDVYCPTGYNQIFWNTLDDYQDEISNGVYLVKVSVETEGANDKVIEKFIIAR